MLWSFDIIAVLADGLQSTNPRQPLELHRFLIMLQQLQRLQNADR